jgi:hypothetical protein
MTTNTSQQFESYVPIYDDVPAKWEEARNLIVEIFRKHANAINDREIGWYLLQQLLTGKSMYASASSTTASQFRSIFRMTVNFGALPNNTTKSVAHGITVDGNFTLVQIWGSATKPTATYAAIPIPYASGTLNKNIEINIDATNINITTSIDYSGYTLSTVVIEYILQP